MCFSWIGNKIQNERHICLYLTPILDYAKKIKTMGCHYAGNGVYDRKRDIYCKC